MRHAQLENDNEIILARNSLTLENQKLKEELQSVSWKINNPGIRNDIDTHVKPTEDEKAATREAVFLECVEANELLQHQNSTLVRASSFLNTSRLSVSI